MYAYINGRVDTVLPDRAILEAGGVGYELLCSGNTLRTLSVGTQKRLWTHLYLAEGIMALYGFAETEERDMFRRLIGVTRVGPKLALAVLSRMTPRDVAGAIVTQNAAAFDHVPGMGRKTAQRVLLELKEKVDTAEMLTNYGIEAPSDSDMASEAVAALVALGYDGVSASRAVTKVKNASGVEDLITKALRSMAK